MNKRFDKTLPVERKNWQHLKKICCELGSTAHFWGEISCTNEVLNLRFSGKY